MTNGRERARRWVHLAFGSLAFAVVALGRPLSIALATSALLYNVVVAPRLGWDRGYRRPGEGRWRGLGTYPLAVLLLVATLPLPLAAGAWIVLAVLDPVAAEAGTRWPAPRVPGNRRKSLVGSAVGFLLGAAACYGLLRFVGAPHAARGALWAAGAGALAEALPLPIDDNLPVAGLAGLALFLNAA